MLVGIISDTHDNVSLLKKAVNMLNENKVELVIHCGDWVSPFMPQYLKELKCEVVSVFGNNEAERHLFHEKIKKSNMKIQLHDKVAEFEMEGKKAALYHGQSRPILKALIKSQDYDYVFSGHTHKALIEQQEKTLHINPGSAGAANLSEATLAILDTETNKAEIVKI